MENRQKIVIGDKIFTRDELFKEKDNFHKERTKLTFEEKIRILVELQKVAYSWDNRKDAIIWKL